MDQPLDASTKLALERTYLAAERTMMAWLRTSTSLITFGFTIFKFSEYLMSEKHRHPVVSPWIIGLTMIVIGLVALVLAWQQHRQQVAAFRARDPELPRSLTGPMTGLIAILGVLALVVVAARL